MNISQPMPDHTHRTVALGRPGSGKSALTRVLVMSEVAAGRQLVVFDEKREIRIEGAHIAYTPRQLDWTKQIQIYRPTTPGDADEYNAVYAQILKRGNVAVWLDEASGVTDSNRTPQNLKNTLQWGRSLRISHYATGQRPVAISPFLLATSDHLVAFARGFSDRDMETLAGHLGIPRRKLQAAFGECRREYGDRSYLHYDVHANRVHLRPPVPIVILRASGEPAG